MAVIRPKTLSWDKDGTTYRLRGITSSEETKIANALTEHQDISGKVDKVTGKGLSTNDYTTTEKNKLAGIEAGANNYTHPSHTAKTSGLYKVTVDSQGHVSAATAVQKSDITGLGIPGSDTTYSAATQSVDGLMSSTDKTKLDGIATGATANVGTITGIKMNGASKGTSGVVDLGTVLTSHQDISGKLNTSLKGAANGLAELDANGKVPSSQLPSYVDDVLEYAGIANFPATGESDKIYIDTATNITYRWGGTEYVPIGSDLAIGETSSTAYRGDRGKIAYDHASAKGSAFSSGLYKITTNAQGHVTAAAAVQKSDITGLGIPGSDTTYSAATQSADGLMSSTDKTKLDGIATGANNYTHPSHTAKSSGLYKVTVDNQGHVTAASAVEKSDITALGIPGSNTDTTYDEATTSDAGLMSAADKTKLDGIDAGANAYTHPSHTAKSSGLYKVTVDNQGHVSAATAVQKSDITGLGIPGSDTTYSAFTGASDSTDGTTGLVPAPSSGDEEKYLKGDGTWGSPGSPSISAIVDMVYPIGSIYMSVVSTSPATLFGGTWEQLKDRFLLGAGDTYSAGDTAGAASKSYTPAGTNSGCAVTAHSYTPAGTNSGCAVTAHSYTPAGTNSGGAVQNHTLTTAEMPKHNHSFTGSAVTSGGISANHTHTGTSGNPSANHTHSGPSHSHQQKGYMSVPDTGGAKFLVSWRSSDDDAGGPYTRDAGTGTTGTVSAWHTHTTTTGNVSAGHTHSVTASGTVGDKGSGGAHNHGFTQPTFTGTAATLSHTVTQPTFTGTAATLSHTVTQPTFTGTAATIDTMPPYLAVYMWKRTA